MKKTLVLAAHPDDGIIGCFGVIKQALDKKEAVKIVYATDGADDTEPRMKASLRKKAVKECWKDYGLQDLMFLDYAVDSTTKKENVNEIFKKLRSIVDKYKPDVMLVPAFEGGHFDHDVLNFLASRMRQKIKVIEFQLYNNHLDPIKFFQIILREIIKKLPLPFTYWNRESFIPIKGSNPFYLGMTKQQIREKQKTYEKYEKITLMAKYKRHIPPLGADLLRELPKHNYYKKPHAGLLPLGYDMAFGHSFETYKSVIKSVKS